MSANPRDELHRLVDALPASEVATARQFLEMLVHPSAMPGAAFFDGTAGRATLVPEEEVPPIGDIDELRGDFWPDDEGTDEFVDAVRTWRRESARA